MKSFLSPLVVLVSAALALSAPARAAVDYNSKTLRYAQPSSSLVEREARYWKRITLPASKGVLLEVGGILPLPGKRLLLTTRHGELWMVDGAYDNDPHPTYTLFASGLHEVLGLCVAPTGGYYVTQRPEVTRVADTDGDGRADLFETVYKIPISGSHHEFAFGPVMAPNGNLLIALNVAFRAATQSSVPWRGWMLEVTPDGQMTPVAAGLRSPCGLLVTSRDLVLYSENQGEWVGSGWVNVVERGDFMGHPAPLAWSRLPGSNVKLRPEDIHNFERPMVEVAKTLPGLKLPTVWFPYTVLGISTSGIAEDLTKGSFGPFAGQFFVGDQGQAKIMRMTLEKVKGVWQGASYAFREGFDCGVVRVAFGADGSLFAGETARGWGSSGPKQEGLERLVWTGTVPFEIKEVTAEPDGFLLTFTQPVDREAAANPLSYGVSGFTYLYHEAYGSPAANQVTCPIRKVVVAPDGMSVRLAVGYLREGYIHEIKAAGVRTTGAGDTTLLHDTAYYTLNRIPDGDRIVPVDPKDSEPCISPIPASAATAMGAATPKHPTSRPADWTPAQDDQTLAIGTQAGLKFDRTLVTVAANTQVKLVFRNSDEMLHNFLLCAPGRGQEVGKLSLNMGVDGMARGYVPDSPDVLYHTVLVQPGAEDTLYFKAPSAPGDYDFICSFPGHSFVMHGVLRVTARP